MGETVLFPEGWQRKLKLGQQALAKQNYQQAVAYLQDAYQEHPDFSTHQQLLLALEKTGDYRQALALVADYQEDYLRDPLGFTQVFRLYLLDQHYLTAKKYLTQGVNNGWVNTKAQKIHEEELALLEKQQLFYDPELPIVKKAELLQIDKSGLPVSQKNWEEWSQGITIESFISITEALLEKISNPFLRPRLVEELLKLGVPDTLNICDLQGEIRSCSLSQLVLPEKDPVLLQMLHYLEAEHGHEDPALLQGVMSEVQAHFALSFPFSPQSAAPDFWAESYWLEYQVAIGEQDDAVLVPFSAIQEIKASYRKLLTALY